MLREIKRQLTFTNRDLLMVVCMALGVALFLTLLFQGVAAATGEINEFIEVGTIGFYGTAVLGFGIVMAVNISTRFNMALRMGALRGVYIPAALCIGAVECFALLLLGNLWHLLEGLLMAFAGVPTGFAAVMKPPFAAVLALAATLFGCWMGALLLRYGKRGFWIVWSLWMLATLGGSQVMSALSASRTDAFARAVQAVAAVWAGLPRVGMAVLVAVPVLAVALHAWLLLHKVAAQD